MIFSAVPHETEEMVKISHMARVRACAQLLHYDFGQNVISFFWWALFFIWGHQLATFLDQPAMLEENLSQKNPGSPK